MAQVKPVSTSEPTVKRVAFSGRWYLLLILLALALLVFDQYTKWLAIQHLTYNLPVPVLQPWLNWTLVHNYGAAFSFMSVSGGGQHWFFVSIAVAAGIGLPIWITRLDRSERMLSLALSCIWAGAIGNLIDRLRFRYVVDFIHVHWRDVWNYPVFNIADSAITVGAVLLIWHELRLWRATRKRAAAAIDPSN
jgi:signal peptidase II